MSYRSGHSKINFSISVFQSFVSVYSSMKSCCSHGKGLQFRTSGGKLTLL